MIGRATTKKLNYYGIYTIGDVAMADDRFMKNLLGKNGQMLQRFARGQDTSPVRHMSLSRDIKSIGNSTTTPRDLKNDEDVKIIFTVLAESVSRRMRKHGVKGVTLTISVRDCKLNTFTRQCTMQAPTNVSAELIKNATFSGLQEMPFNGSTEQQLFYQRCHDGNGHAVGVPAVWAFFAF